jgi:hypothetical protein
MLHKFARLAVFRALPAELREPLNRRILAGELDVSLRTWCQEQGYTFDRSTFNRYAKRVRDNPEAVAEASPRNDKARELIAVVTAIHSLERRKESLLREMEGERSGAS